MVQSYYDRKTQSILRKFGPGPRVHFHIGVYDDPPRTNLATTELSRDMVAAQELMLRRAAQLWDARRVLSGEVLDVGCGLGGGALFWAKEHGARVTAVTIASEHIPHLRSFASTAGVGDRVQPLLCDCCEVPGDHRFVTAVAMESACYFPRHRWFRRLAELLQPGGFVCIEDTFLGSARQWKQPFDAYWHTDVAPVEEYVHAARSAGFVLDRAEDVTELTSDFWLQSVAWSEAVLATQTLADDEQRRLQNSIDWHRRFHRAWCEGGIDVQLLRFHHRASLA
jgi:tocopherol O-methyltransferase